jgi:hypothetical protein
MTKKTTTDNADLPCFMDKSSATIRVFEKSTCHAAWMNQDSVLIRVILVEFRRHCSAKENACSASVLRFPTKGIRNGSLGN